MPAPVPAPPLQRTGRSRSASRRRQASSTAASPAASQRSSASSRPASTVSTAAGSSPSVAAVSRSSAGRSRGIDRHVDPDPQHGPAVLRAPLHEDARQLAPVDQHVVGPLERRARSAGGLRGLRHRHAGGERQQRRRVAQHQRAQQRRARGRAPAPTLAPAARGLLCGGHERAVRRARQRQVARPGVGGVGDAQVQVRSPERARSAHAGRMTSSLSGAIWSVSAASPRLMATASIR